MHILKFTYYCRYLSLIFLFGWVACTQENYDVLSEGMDTDIPISWRVQSEQGHEARALVDNSMLQTSCKESDGGSQESIGVWGEYTMNVGGQNETNEIFSATPLTYSLQEEAYAWAYSGDPRYWRSQAVYNFRACYPQTLMESLMTDVMYQLPSPGITRCVVDAAAVRGEAPVKLSGDKAKPKSRKKA